MSHDSVVSLSAQKSAAADSTVKLADFILRLEPPDCADESVLASVQREARELGGARVVLTWGVPGVPDPLVQSWLGKRWWIWPDGIPAERRWCFPSSRLSRSLDLEVEWFRRLRAACSETLAADGRVVLVAGAAGEPLVRHAAVRAGIRRLEVMVGEARTTRLVRQTLLDYLARDHLPSVVCRLWLGPGNEDGCLPELASIPLRDRALLMLGEELRPLAVRKGGHTARLLAARCLESPLIGRRSTPRKSGPSVRRGLGNSVAEEKQLGELQLERWPWPALVHWTRRREGPWPGQSEEQFWDELLEERRERDRSALAVLKHIVSERRLRASEWALRGGESMVCWAEVTPPTLAARRVFRAHRHRWDFEPYGLAVSREWLEQRGARPVIYGDLALWERLAPDDRPWFQRLGTRGGRRGRSIDWRVEQEWRVRGDVDLANLPRESAIVFVPDVEAAQVMASVSPWPVRIVSAAPLPESTEPA